jgi:hypothetical protein
VRLGCPPVARSEVDQVELDPLTRTPPRPAGPPAGVYASEIFQHGRGDATVFIPTDGTARAVGRVERLVVPPAELAIMLHRGSLADGDLTYGELGAT